MPSDPSFVAHALDLVSLLAPVQARAMFGGHGLYAQGVMFGLLDDGELFLKTDAETRATFVAAGCRQWTYVNKKVRMENTGYFRPPDDAHEEPEAMLPWARLALEVALRSRAAKTGKRPQRRAQGVKGNPRARTKKGVRAPAGGQLRKRTGRAPRRTE
jgi:DNA transformation protein and related proteins